MKKAWSESMGSSWVVLVSYREICMTTYLSISWQVSVCTRLYRTQLIWLCNSGHLIQNTQILQHVCKTYATLKFPAVRKHRTALLLLSVVQEPRPGTCAAYRTTSCHHLSQDPESVITSLPFCTDNNCSALEWWRAGKLFAWWVW